MKECELCRGSVEINKIGDTRFYINLDKARIARLERERAHLIECLEAIANKETAGIFSKGLSDKYNNYEQAWDMVAAFARQSLSRLSDEEGETK